MLYRPTKYDILFQQRSQMCYTVTPGEGIAIAVCCFIVSHCNVGFPLFVTQFDNYVFCGCCHCVVLHIEIKIMFLSMVRHEVYVLERVKHLIDTLHFKHIRILFIFILSI